MGGPPVEIGMHDRVSNSDRSRTAPSFRRCNSRWAGLPKVVLKPAGNFSSYSCAALFACCAGGGIKGWHGGKSSNATDPKVRSTPNCAALVGLLSLARVGFELSYRVRKPCPVLEPPSRLQVAPAPSPRNHSSYDAAYYGPNGPAENRDSAQHVVPLVSSLIHPSSVVDVGCGSGAWLDVFRKHGASRILGLDGYNVDPAWLCIPQDCFRALDLSKPFQVAEVFDLAVCLEVAEHLPKDAAPGFIQSLARLAPGVLFSAAVPLQGGTHHVNEQWPGYWQDLFENGATGRWT